MNLSFNPTWEHCSLNNFLYLTIETSTGPVVEFAPTIFPELQDYFYLYATMAIRIEREKLCPPRK